MGGTPTSDQIKFGILRTRDLVELYYQGRMVVQVRENDPGTLVLFTPVQILRQDPRRTRYEIIIANGGNTTLEVQIGSLQSINNTNYGTYSIAAGDTLVIIRDFRSDLEGVCLEQFAMATVGNAVVTTREDFLTPLPADEVP